MEILSPSGGEDHLVIVKTSRPKNESSLKRSFIYSYGHSYVDCCLWWWSRWSHAATIDLRLWKRSRVCRPVSYCTVKVQVIRLTFSWYNCAKKWHQLAKVPKSLRKQHLNFNHTKRRLGDHCSCTCILTAVLVDVQMRVKCFFLFAQGIWRYGFFDRKHLFETIRIN